MAEDNEVDVQLTRRSFMKAKLALHLQHVRNGEECIDFLQRQGKYSNAPRPDLLLLDLNMPKVSGREVLAALARDPVLSLLPVALLTATHHDEEVLQAYELARFRRSRFT